MSLVTGMTKTKMAIPVTTAPVSQPQREMMKASIGARITPPIACDAMPIPIARPFLRLNQLLIVAQFGAKTADVRPRDTMNVHVTTNSNRVPGKEAKEDHPQTHEEHARDDWRPWPKAVYEVADNRREHSVLRPCQRNRQRRDGAADAPATAIRVEEDRCAVVGDAGGEAHDQAVGRKNVPAVENSPASAIPAGYGLW